MSLYIPEAGGTSVYWCRKTLKTPRQTTFWQRQYCSIKLQLRLWCLALMPSAHHASQSISTRTIPMPTWFRVYAGKHLLYVQLFSVHAATLSPRCIKVELIRCFTSPCPQIDGGSSRYSFKSCSERIQNTSHVLLRYELPTPIFPFLSFFPSIFYDNLYKNTKKGCCIQKFPRSKAIKPSRPNSRARDMFFVVVQSRPQEHG